MNIWGSRSIRLAECVAAWSFQCARSVAGDAGALWSGVCYPLVGVALGLAAAHAATSLVAGMLYGVSGRDPFTFTAVSLLLGSVARVDPTVALSTNDSVQSASADSAKNAY